MNGVFWLMKCGMANSYDRKEVIERLKKGLSKYKKEDKQFSMLLKEIIDKTEHNDTVTIECNEKIRIVYDNRKEPLVDGNEKIQTVLLKGKNAIRLDEIFFSDEGESNINKKKMMKREFGFFVIDNDEEGKFEGIIACMHNNIIQVKRGFYDNRNGQYVQKDLLIIDNLRGTGMENFKGSLIKVATNKLKCGLQIPEIAITKEAMEFIEK